MKVLLVKLSSMGDVIHALPAITDASHAVDDIQFDWVVDEGFADIPTWHASVNRVIKSAHRRWRKSIIKTITHGEFKTFHKQLRQDQYDLVLDAQGNFKSAAIAFLAKGKRVGLDKHSAAESIAAIAYQEKYTIDKNQHAILRLRQLFADALSYPLVDSEPDYAICRDKLEKCPVELPENYYMFIHNASWDSKCWPENYWHDLICHAKDENRSVVLPWGNTTEKERAERLNANYDHVIVLPQLNLSQMASVIANAIATVGVDTGLSHLTAALNIPSIALYGPTDPGLIGTTGEKQLHLRANFACAPCRERTCLYKGKSTEKPACFTTLPPDLVWDKLQFLLKD